MTKEVPICRHPDGGKCEHCIDYEPEATLEDRVKQLEFTSGVYHEHFQLHQAEIEMVRKEIKKVDTYAKAVEGDLNVRATYAFDKIEVLEARLKAIEDKLNWRSN